MKKSNKDESSSENGSNKKVANLTTKSGPMKFHLGGATPTTNLLVLNEVVIDRGPSPYLSNIDLYLDGKLITSVQGDGLIVSTPTGSTAYAVAAGASMIHPSVPAIMVTPICPHSLSFRPIVVPAGVELKVHIVLQFATWLTCSLFFFFRSPSHLTVATQRGCRLMAASVKN